MSAPPSSIPDGRPSSSCWACSVAGVTVASGPTPRQLPPDPGAALDLLRELLDILGDLEWHGKKIALCVEYCHAHGWAPRRHPDLRLHRPGGLDKSLGGVPTSHARRDGSTRRNRGQLPGASPRH